MVAGEAAALVGHHSLLTAEVPDDPLVVLVQVNLTVLSGGVERRADLRMVVDQAVHADETGVGRPVVVGIDVGEEHAVPRVDGALRGFSHEIETTGGIEPATMATVFACLIPASLLIESAAAPI